MDSKQAIS